jgi:hypothetical protein
LNRLGYVVKGTAILVDMYVGGTLHGFWVDASLPFIDGYRFLLSSTESQSEDIPSRIPSFGSSGVVILLTTVEPRTPVPSAEEIEQYI